MVALAYFGSTRHSPLLDLRGIRHNLQRDHHKENRRGYKKRPKPNLTMSAKPPIVGTASMSNPFHPGYKSGGAEAASGERYDPSAFLWLGPGITPC